MKRIVLFAALVTGLLTSCSAVYQSGQTPDDLYYSPGPSADVLAARQEKADRDNDLRNRNGQDEYQEYISSADDRYLHMKVANRSRWDELDNYSYWYDSRYDFSNYNYYNSMSVFNRYGLYAPYLSAGIYSAFNPYFSSYAYYNPYFGSLGYAGYGGYGGYGYGAYGGGYGWSNPRYTLVSYANPKFNPGTTSFSGLSAYGNRSYSNRNSNYVLPSPSNSFGSLVRRVFTGSTSNGTPVSSFDRPARSFSTPTPSNPAPSSSAGGNSGGFKSTGSTTSTGRGGKN